MKIWTFNSKTKKLSFFDCPLGHIKRQINCISIDSTDALAFCGTRSGDLLEIALNRGIYNRSGPVEKKFQAGISQIISKFKHLYIGANDGTFAKIDKKTLCISGEANFPDSSITALTASESKVYNVSNRSIVRSVQDTGSFQNIVPFMNGHYGSISQIAFPANFGEVFASCSLDEIRIWNTPNQKELLKIELSAGSSSDYAQSNCVEFMPDGKSIVSGWSDGKIRCFLP